MTAVWNRTGYNIHGNDITSALGYPIAISSNLCGVFGGWGWSTQMRRGTYAKERPLIKKRLTISKFATNYIRKLGCNLYTQCIISYHRPSFLSPLSTAIATISHPLLPSLERGKGDTTCRKKGCFDRSHSKETIQGCDLGKWTSTCTFLLHM